jgi:redox-sensitive bicupin YhaK (pirin superfamily)
MNNKTIHRADTRGHANHGWLNAYHTFSFANYYQPDRVHFGALRVLNDDTIDAGMGFGTHPHDNMEIITIPLEGDLEHRDSMGNSAVVRNGDIQVMSAGTGITHSEYNKNRDKRLKLLQIWVFPNRQNVKPRYGQVTLEESDRHNKLQLIVSPDANDGPSWINQDAWFHLGKFDKGVSAGYKIKKEGNGLYIFVLSGQVTVDGEKLNTRDGMGITDFSSLTITADTDSEFLLMEVPMAIK